MKKYNQPLDDFFRDALKDHTILPSDGAREAFLKEAAMVADNKKPGKRWFLLLLGGIAIVMTGIGLYLIMGRTQQSLGPAGKAAVTPTVTRPVAASPQPVTASLSPSSSPSTSSKSQIPGEKMQSIHSSSFNQPAIIHAKTKPNKVSEHSGKSDLPKYENQAEPLLAQDNTSPQDNPVPVVAQVTQPVPIKPNEPIADPVVAVSAMPTPHDTANPVKKSAQDSVRQILSANPVKKGTRARQDKNWSISAGAYYSPEWMFNILEDEKFVNSFGVEGIFRYGNYSVRTGAGLSITKGTNELSISYNDYLGYYPGLDSMSFKWNTQHTKLVPTYYLTDKSVYDSLMKLDEAKIVKRYTYLQIPLILGYDFWNNEKFSIGVRAGPVLSVLLYSKQLSGNYDPGLNRVITINQISPERIQTNWQVMGGINGTWYISRQFGLELEPEVRYYFNSVYEKTDNSNKPWSVGFRAAFHFIH